MRLWSWQSGGGGDVGNWLMCITVIFDYGYDDGSGDDVDGVDDDYADDDGGGDVSGDVCVMALIPQTYDPTSSSDFVLFLP